MDEKLLLVALALAVVSAVSPAVAGSATLSQRVSALEAKLACLTWTPGNEFSDYAEFGDEFRVRTIDDGARLGL